MYFLDEPKIKIDLKNKKKPYKLMNNITFVCDYFTIKINKGYSWDGASIIKPLWSLIGSKGQPDYLVASLIHDFCTEWRYRFTIKESSIVFRDLLIMYGVNPIKANIMMIAVWLWQALLPMNRGWKR